MRKIGNICLLLGLVTYLYYYAVVEGEDCDNEAGYCYDYSFYMWCYFSNNDTQLMNALVNSCGSQRTELITMHLYKNYYSTTYGELIVSLDLPSNIQVLFLYNAKDLDNMRLTTSSQNTGLTRIYSRNRVEIESHNFFDNFTGLQSITIGYIVSKTPTTFTNLQLLTYLKARITGPDSHTFDNTIISGLSNLRFVNFDYSYFNGIIEGAFDDMAMLSYINFDSNKIKYIEDGVFAVIPNLKMLFLSNNGIKSVSTNVFAGLIHLTYLSVSDNREFPIEALLQTKSVVQLHIQYNEYHTLDPYVFQQMNKLFSVYLDNPFVCDCKLEWVSRVSQYGITIYYGECFEPNDVFHEVITNPMLYTNCSNTESFQCFDKSVICPIHQICHNTKDSYFCDCPIGYALNAIAQCGDIDECNEQTNCTQSCENTDGSFYCVCDEGYKLATNGYDCDDVNECQEWNGGCQFGCNNTIGSYQCYCGYGHKLYNETHCEEGLQCELIGDSCINPIDSNYYCKGGFNLSINNLSCPNVNTNSQLNETTDLQTEFQWIISTVTLLAISLVTNVFLIIMFVGLFIYFVRKVKKMQSLLKGEETQEHHIYKNYTTNESHNYVELLELQDEVQETLASPKENKYPNLLTEVYTESVKDDSVKY